MEKKDENRSRKITIRLKPAEYKSIEARFHKSRFRRLSEYSRNVLLEKPVTIFHRNQSLDETLEELILLRKELNAVGNNFNQIVRKLNSIKSGADTVVWQSALTLLRDQLEPCIRQIKERIIVYSDLWSRRLSAEKA